MPYWVSAMWELESLGAIEHLKSNFLKIFLHFRATGLPSWHLIKDFIFGCKHDDMISFFEHYSSMDFGHYGLAHKQDKQDKMQRHWAGQHALKMPFIPTNYTLNIIV